MKKPAPAVVDNYMIKVIQHHPAEVFHSNCGHLKNLE